MVPMLQRANAPQRSPRMAAASCPGPRQLGSDPHGRFRHSGDCVAGTRNRAAITSSGAQLRTRVRASGAAGMTAMPSVRSIRQLSDSLVGIRSTLAQLRSLSAPGEASLRLGGGGWGWGKAAHAGASAEASADEVADKSAIPEWRPHPNPPPQAGEGARRRRSWLEMIGFTESIP